MDTSPSIFMVYADGTIRSRMESARALPPNLWCQPSGVNWEQKMVDA